MNDAIEKYHSSGTDPETKALQVRLPEYEHEDCGNERDYATIQGPTSFIEALIGGDSMGTTYAEEVQECLDEWVESDTSWPPHWNDMQWYLLDTPDSRLDCLLGLHNPDGLSAGYVFHDGYFHKVGRLSTSMSLQQKLLYLAAWTPDEPDRAFGLPEYRALARITPGTEKTDTQEERTEE
jgi:hypothetical protein